MPEMMVLGAEQETRYEKSIARLEKKIARYEKESVRHEKESAMLGQELAEQETRYEKKVRVHVVPRICGCGLII